MRNLALETENQKVKKTRPLLEAHLLTEWWGRQSHANYSCNRTCDGV